MHFQCMRRQLWHAPSVSISPSTLPHDLGMGNERSMNLLDLPTIQPFWGLESAGNENGSMAKKVEQKSYDGAVAWRYAGA